MKQSQRAEARLKELVKSIERFEEKLKQLGKLNYGASENDIDAANRKYFKSLIQSEQEAIAMIIRNLI